LNAAVSTYERACGATRLEFKAGPDGRTVLTDLYQRAPCRVLFPESESDEPIQAVLLTTSGGLTGGDRVRVDVNVRAGAQVTVTTQAAEKLYRALAQDDATKVDIGMTVEAGCWAEWLAQETILFNGARLRREFQANVSGRGRLLAVDTVVLGRTAMGECFDTGFLHDAWRIRRDGRLIWADALHMPADITEAPQEIALDASSELRPTIKTRNFPGTPRLRAARFGFGTAVACSTVVYVGDDVAQQLAAARKLLGESRVLRASPLSITAAATALDGLLLVRVLADDAAEMRAAIMELIGGLRRSAGGLPPRLPRVWQC
jgi:urease accessory protein